MFTHSFSRSFTCLIVHLFTLHSSVVYYTPSLGKKCEEDRHCSLQWSILDYSQQKFIVKHFSLYSKIIPPSPHPIKGLQHWARNPLDGEVLNRGNGVGRGRRRIHSVEGRGHSPPHLTNWRRCNKFLGSKWNYGCCLTMEAKQHWVGVD